MNKYGIASSLPWIIAVAIIIQGIIIIINIMYMNQMKSNFIYYIKIVILVIIVFEINLLYTLKN